MNANTRLSRVSSFLQCQQLLLPAVSLILIGKDEDEDKDTHLPIAFVGDA